MRKILFLIILGLNSSLFCLEKAPWFGDIYEFHFLSKYTYFYYNKVNGAIIPLESTSKNHLLQFNLAFSFAAELSIDSDLEFLKTAQHEFNFSTVAFQARYLLKDDIVGDPISACIGANIRVVSPESLKDVSVLYHGNVEFEGNVALGKEFSQSEFWRFRFWLYASGGIATKGSPWLIEKVSIEGNLQEKKKWALFLEAMQCLGNEEKIDIYDFNGYGNVKERNLDIGLRYGLRFGVWGTVSFEYRRRLIAEACPENVNFFSISYLLPFCF